MPRGTELTATERGQILVLRHQNMSLSAIARSFGRSRKAVGAFFKNLDGCGTAKRTGRPRKLTERERRVVFRQATVMMKPTSEIAVALSDAKFELVSKRTVQRELVRTGMAKYVKQKQTPRLKLEHKKARVMWCREQLKAKTIWTKIIFSDEKKFNLDGPDGLKYYWHDLRKEKKQYFSRQTGGGSIMVWGGFSKAGKSELALLVGRQKSFDYQQTLTDYLFPFADGHMDGDYVFQQDNASIHASASTTAFLRDLNIPVLRWPSLSPDLNPIENLWGDMARAVYCEGKQYETVDELKDAVLKAWTNIPQSRLDALIASMSDRCLDVVSCQGVKINY